MQPIEPPQNGPAGVNKGETAGVGFVTPSLYEQLTPFAGRLRGTMLVSMQSHQQGVPA